MNARGVVASEEVRKKSEEIFMVLTNRRFVRYRPKDDFKVEIIEKIMYAAERRSPIIIVVGFGYHKNPNATSNLLPDQAEEETIQRLFELAKTVEEIYPYGMRVKIITSGRRAEIVNGVIPCNTQQYHWGLVNLVEARKWGRLIAVIPICDLYEERWDDLQIFLKRKEEEAKAEIANNLNVDFWNNQIEYARRNINRNNLSLEQVEEKAKASAIKYISFRRSEAAINLLAEKFPGSIVGSYNNDSSTTLKLWTLRKGYITQPWQGTAKIIGGKIEVITQVRKEKL